MLLYWAGWYCQGGSDKIWGILKDGDNIYNFWCRRGKQMQFKKIDSLKFSHKEQKGYQSISKEMLEKIYPGFFSEAENKLVLDILKDKIR